MFKTGIKKTLQEGIQVIVTTSCLLINCLNLIKSREGAACGFVCFCRPCRPWPCDLEVSNTKKVSRFPVVKVHGRNQYMVTEVPEFTGISLL